jgi:hypothetical protein
MTMDEIKIADNEWISVIGIPATIKNPRNGIFGRLFDGIFGCKEINNPDPFAGYWIATTKEGRIYSSEDGIIWAECSNEKVDK